MSYFKYILPVYFTSVNNFMVVFQPAKPDDLCVLCYTSGTTGNIYNVCFNRQGIFIVHCVCTVVYTKQRRTCKRAGL